MSITSRHPKTASNSSKPIKQLKTTTLDAKTVEKQDIFRIESVTIQNP